LRKRLGVVPVTITRLLDAWKLDEATAAMEAARLAWDAADATVASVPSIPSTNMPVRVAVLGSTTTAALDDAAALGAKQLALATDVAAALVVKAEPRDAIQQLGLLGTIVPGDETAIDAVTRIDPAAVAAATEAIRSTIGAARDAGIQRLAVIVGSIIGVLGVLAALILLRRRSRRRRARAGESAVVPEAPAGP
jgi:hypothetical protein